MFAILVSCMRQQLWHLVVTSGCCATHLFWKMVVLWYVTLYSVLLSLPNSNAYVGSVQL